MKNTTILACLLLACLLLSACTTVFNDKTDLSARGTWHNHIYVNHFMGFQFEMPPTWTHATDTEIANALNLTWINLDNQWGYLPESVPFLASQDMRANDFFARNTVTVSYFPIVGRFNLNEQEYLYSLIPYFERMNENHRAFSVAAYPKVVGEVNWYYMTFQFQENLAQINLINFYNDIARSITILAYDGDMNTLNELWNLFQTIDPSFYNMVGTIPKRSIDTIASRGSWNGLTYINPTLGLQLTVPYYYEIYTDSDIASVMNVPPSLLYGHIISDDLWGRVTVTQGGVAHIMQVYGPRRNVYSSIGLSVRHIPLGLRDFYLLNYVEGRINVRKQMWQTVLDIPPIVVIRNEGIELAGHSWDSGTLKITTPNVDFRIDVLVAIVNDFIWEISILSEDAYQFQEKLSLFS